eukprot:UN29890
MYDERVDPAVYSRLMTKIFFVAVMAGLIWYTVANDGGFETFDVHKTLQMKNFMMVVMVFLSVPKILDSSIGISFWWFYRDAAEHERVHVLGFGKVSLRRFQRSVWGIRGIILSFVLMIFIGLSYVLLVLYILWRVICHDIRMEIAVLISLF